MIESVVRMATMTSTSPFRSMMVQVDEPAALRLLRD